VSQPYYRYQDPLEGSLQARVSADLLMEHVRAIGAWERESGTAGEAQAFDYIERALKQYHLDVERGEIEAYISLPHEGRLVVSDGSPGGSLIEGLTHAFSPSTDGLDGEVVDVGAGTAEDHARLGSAGKIALIDGLASPGRAWTAQQAGTIAQIFVNMDHLHNMIVTTVWGTPTPDTTWRIPRTPCLSIRADDAQALRQRLQRGPTRVRVVTRVTTGWSPIPHLVAHLPGTQEDRFVLFSGHVDAWHHGAMDNGTANATMLEVARLLGGRREALRRGLRLAFWSGHSHGRYAGSTWYADHAWHDLHRRCVVHLNVDSTGARGATDYSVFHATEDAQSFAEAVVEDVTGQTGRARHFSRAGDQSFWGIGVPSAFMSLSGIPRQDTELSRAMERLFGTAGFPWWWHTREDTVDKIDPAVLSLDTRVYVAAALRLLNAPVLPLEPRRLARALAATLEGLQSAARSRFDLGPAADAARRLVERAEVLGAVLDPLQATSTAPERLDAANRLLMRLSRLLVPLAYTTGDRFAHDLALPVEPLAGLQAVRELVALDPAGSAFKFGATAAVRERNRAVAALDEARQTIDDHLNRKEIRA
jgi:N-acetylated-alpha-linked acidic dipeptidase